MILLSSSAVSYRVVHGFKNFRKGIFQPYFLSLELECVGNVGVTSYSLKGRTGGELKVLSWLRS